MPYTFTVQVDADMMKRAWNAYFFRRTWTLGMATALILGGAAVEFTGGRLSTISIVGLTTLATMLLLFVAAYFGGRRRALSKLEAIVDGKATYTLTDTRIEAVSSLGSLSLAWSAIAELRRRHDLILLGFRGAMYSTIPVSQIPGEALAFLVERCRAAGARMVDL